MASSEDLTIRVDVGRTIADVQKELIIKTVALCRQECKKGPYTKAAKLLGISIRNLALKRKEYGI